ncbi:MAG: M20/M25/M40 family metallo-hydrolase [Bdellovibrionaceae bacterium]|nr:M20/M25/M40 family metallo-hydrolase [Pseudobdellovibrionaceae bacterium]
MKKIIFIVSLLVSLKALAGAAPVEPDYVSLAKSFRKTLSDLVKAKTVSPPGNEKRAVEILGARLKKEGIPFNTMDFDKNRSNLVARLKGSGEKRPLLLLAHIDVVGVDQQSWSTPPHVMTEKEGFLYGRGVQDDLGMAVSNLEVFIALKKLKIKLKRDVILAFTGDEESGGEGIKAILKKHPEWIADAEIGLNEGGSPVTNDGEQVMFINIATAEKTYQDFVMQAQGATGHSSLPHGDNAIALIAQAVDRLARHKPEQRLLPVTREYFKKRAEVEKGALAQAMKDIAASEKRFSEKSILELEKYHLQNLLITTCIPTMVSGGSRVNALPPQAMANINCRILPDETIETVKKRLISIINDPRIELKAEGDFSVGGASDVAGVVPAAVEKIAKQMWPGVTVIPSMLSGATDSRFLQGKTQMYGVSPLYRLERDAARAHGVDERLPVGAILPGLEYMYKLVLELGDVN